ncbi:hypothetical protein H310_14642 [Aphanomyces invadans]|uniref:Uncharacterized protein n=1 Tax=Aphanomyces invadans TaxID=157072 RepID=A0A024TAF6_9STRA|nr:hypothetical protein H310_14642 [Aphanomyces invadans]ETV90606.1 hypothetical protein H310_14642 [Aphanomyces invadans]|eukprot:XP_008880759.1 hypothetical protein H310_14642 [Aphanomyces invadans]
MSIPDADSRIGRMLDGLAAAIRRDRQEWVIKEESQAIVKIIQDAIKPASLNRAVAEQMVLSRNKPLKKDVRERRRFLLEEPSSLRQPHSHRRRHRWQPRRRTYRQEDGSAVAV